MHDPPPPWAYARRRLAAHFQPIPHLQRAPYSGPVEELALETADGVTIAATLLRRRSDRLVILCHGFAASQRAAAIVWLAELLAARYAVLTFDWRGYGRSGGLASLGGAEAHDLAATIHAARSLGYPQVGVVAESMGGLITLAALGAAAADPGFPLPDAVATISAPADYNLTGGLRPLLVRHIAPLPWLRPVAPLIGFRLGDLQVPRPLDLVRHISVPLLLIHGDRDSTVPLRNAHLLSAAAPSADLRVYPGVDHAVVGLQARAPRRLLDDLFAWFS